MSKTLSNWWYKQATQSEWTKGRQTPTTEIFADLLANEAIPDPFIDDNEKQVQWVGEADWWYKTEFDVDQVHANSRLVFDGLDTFCTVLLNGKQILTTDNMFTQYKVDIEPKVGTNTLELHFVNALQVGRDLQLKYGKLQCWNGEASRVYVRKAQYHYGWDWGPVMISTGPYKPIRFETYDSFVDDVYVKVDVDENLNVNVDVQIEVVGKTGQEVNLQVASPKGEVVHTATGKVDKAISWKFAIDKPQLWFPVGYGNPDLYQFTVSLGDQKVVKNVGLRRLQLVQEPLVDQEGTSFYFQINNIPVYINGSNWIPDHSILTLLNDKTYSDSLALMINGNQNMIRVWAGGIYEYDIFYEKCDQLGLLVWQDFMFACGVYPGYDEFVKSVTAEVDHQVKRLRNHCSLALFAGNNEDYQIAEELNIDYSCSVDDEYTKKNFPARVFYEKIIPTIVEANSTVPYHYGSPYGGKDSTDQTIGDIHQWNVWHGDQKKYQDWYKLGGRFVSEFGMLALPNIKTYQDCITDETEMYPQSRLVDHHNRSDGFERRLALYVTENIKMTLYDLKSWIYATQLMQAECLGYAYKCWRREWKGKGKRYSGGAIVWQINDCWPVASWALVDFYNRPKLAYYSVKRESAPLGLGLYRNEVSEKKAANNDTGVGAEHDLKDKEYTVDIWGVNSSVKEEVGELAVDIYHITSGEIIKSFVKPVTLEANSSTQFETGLPLENAGDVVVNARFVQLGADVVSAADWPQPLKYLKFPNRSVEMKVEDGKITVTTNKPVKGVEITLDLEIFLQDNGFDLFPNQVKVVEAEGLKSGDKTEITYYQKE